jgi:purine-binding chemotaxis protein CheW
MHQAPLSWQKGTLLHQSKDKSYHYVLFRIDRHYYALALDHVFRALRMVALAPVPEMPDWVLGMINIAGKTIPVINLRYLFNQKNKEPELQDRLLILKILEQTAAIVVDEILNIIECTLEQIKPPPFALSHTLALTGTFQYDNALVMILDADRLLPQITEDRCKGANT